MKLLVPFFALLAAFATVAPASASLPAGGLSPLHCDCDDGCDGGGEEERAIDGCSGDEDDG